jgi:Rps23 Pro-64 3,4-dihydroxylase Tpa1-like proline 4-hydroxylase
LSQNPENTSTAVDEYNNPLKKNKGIFLDNLFHNQRQNSKILQHNRKIFKSDIVNQIIEADPVFSLLSTSRIDTTLISYYHDGDYYLPHIDNSSVTILSYFLAENILFEGGNLAFVDKDITIQPKNNMTILALGSYKHAVSMIRKMSEDSPNVLRICMSQFCYHPL